MNLDDFLAKHRLPRDFLRTAEDFYVPAATCVEACVAARDAPGFVLGISGAQGTGKSTIASFICEYVASEFGRNAVTLSLDDLYLTRTEREELAQNVHPLLATRGVPGTHDIRLGHDVLAQLKGLRRGQEMSVPRFDKAADDRAPVAQWPVVHGPVDLIVFEGWCVGASPEPQAALADPVNTLEARDDANGSWRRWVNERLADDYARLFEHLDALLFLAAPDFAAVLRWRLEQEHKLRAAAHRDQPGIMNDDDVQRFVQHFERITRASLVALPARADRVIHLGNDHQAIAASDSRA